MRCLLPAQPAKTVFPNYSDASLAVYLGSGSPPAMPAPALQAEFLLEHGLFDLCVRQVSTSGLGNLQQCLGIVAGE